MYIWEHANWPHFIWSEAELSTKLASTRHLQGRLLGRMEALVFKLREEAVLETLIQDVVTTSEIEGEKLDTQQVRSSLARRLGMDAGALPAVDRHVEGVVDMMLDATGRFRDPLTADRLFGWQAALFPTGRSGISKIRVGCWRDDANGPMQVVSGSYGRERIHYQAPPAERVPGEVDHFLGWMNAVSAQDPVIKAAVAHFWFVTIHPFEDGNGRIARAIADLALARSEETSQRFYSMSAQIQHERAAYYDLLERQQKSDLDITVWIAWFLDILCEAFQSADTILINIIRKSNFWECASNHPLNARQIKVLNRLLDGFQGKMTSSKWAKIGDCSQDTANRDIAFLIDVGLLRRGPAGGRSTDYELVFQED